MHARSAMSDTWRSSLPWRFASERLEDQPLARLHERKELARPEPLEVLGLPVLLPRGAIAVLLVDHERGGVLGIAARLVALDARLLAGGGGELLHHLGGPLLVARGG